MVHDGWRKRVLGTMLLQLLVEAAQKRGVASFRAYILASNAHMLHLVSRFTDVRERTMERGVVELLFTARPAPAS